MSRLWGIARFGDEEHTKSRYIAERETAERMALKKSRWTFGECWGVWRAGDCEAVAVNGKLYTVTPASPDEDAAPADEDESRRVVVLPHYTLMPTEQRNGLKKLIEDYAKAGFTEMNAIELTGAGATVVTFSRPAAPDPESAPAEKAGTPETINSYFAQRSNDAMAAEIDRRKKAGFLQDSTASYNFELGWLAAAHNSRIDWRHSVNPAYKYGYVEALMQGYAGSLDYD